MLLLQDFSSCFRTVLVLDPSLKDLHVGMQVSYTIFLKILVIRIARRRDMTFSVKTSNRFDIS